MLSLSFIVTVNQYLILNQRHSFFFIFVKHLCFSVSLLLFLICRSHFSSQEDCQLCLPGYYCAAEGLLAPSGECWEGFFCLEGADRPNPPLRDRHGGPCPRGDHVLHN